MYFLQEKSPALWHFMTSLTLIEITATTTLSLQVSSAAAQRWREASLTWPAPVPLTACSLSDTPMRTTASCWTSASTTSSTTLRWLCRPCRQPCKGEGRKCADHLSSCPFLLRGVFHALALRRDIAFSNTGHSALQKIPQLVQWFAGVFPFPRSGLYKQRHCVGNFYLLLFYKLRLSVEHCFPKILVRFF